MAGILNISEAATLAMHAVVLMAQNEERVISTIEAARQFNGSEAHLSKVLQTLVKSGIVTSVRGPKGGYKLARAAEEITLLQVFEAIEGPFMPTNCLFAEEICDGKSCITGGLVHEVSVRVKEYLSSSKLSDLTSFFTLKGNEDCALSHVTATGEES